MLVGTAIKAKYKQRIYDGLKREFGNIKAIPGYGDIADQYWLKLADAISDIAIDLVNEIHSNAEVVEGIPVDTNGTPTHHTGVTIAPGKIR